jgi:hypothetical protein
MGFLDVTPCILVDKFQLFERIFACIFITSWSIEVDNSETSVPNDKSSWFHISEDRNI